MRFTAFLLCIPALLATQAASAQKPPPLQPGEYSLQAEGGSTRTGTLTVHSATASTASFSLLATVCRQDCGTERAVPNYGEITKAEMALQKASGYYLYRGPQEAGTAPCTLRVTPRPHHAIAVVQQGQCADFGVGVDASGTYAWSGSGGKVAAPRP